MRNLRDELGWNKQEFANLVGKPQSTISKIENSSINVSLSLLN
ncbi:helix-turn-helix transcriptional regulator [Pediococcus acidilactici]